MMFKKIINQIKGLNDNKIKNLNNSKNIDIEKSFSDIDIYNKLINLIDNNLITDFKIYFINIKNSFDFQYIPNNNYTSLYNDERNHKKANYLNLIEYLFSSKNISIDIVMYICKTNIFEKYVSNRNNENIFHFLLSNKSISNEIVRYVLTEQKEYLTGYKNINKNLLFNANNQYIFSKQPLMLLIENQKFSLKMWDYVLRFSNIFDDELNFKYNGNISSTIYKEYEIDKNISFLYFIFRNMTNNYKYFEFMIKHKNYIDFINKINVNKDKQKAYRKIMNDEYSIIKNQSIVSLIFDNKSLFLPFYNTKNVFLYIIYSKYYNKIIKNINSEITEDNLIEIINKNINEKQKNELILLILSNMIYFSGYDKKLDVYFNMYSRIDFLPILSDYKKNKEKNFYYMKNLIENGDNNILDFKSKYFFKD